MLRTIKILSRSVWGLSLVYVLIRVLAFATYFYPQANEISAGFLVGAYLYVCHKNLKLGWLILVGELLLDGAGHFFELQSLLLRTWFLGIFGLMWFGTKIISFKTNLETKNFQIGLPRPIIFSLLGLGVIVVGSIINGFLSQHTTSHILQDAILFCFLFLFFPALEFARELELPLVSYIRAWIIGSALFSLITFFIYSTGLGTLPDSYYHWFRNIANGKITDLGNNFFRIVLPEHLFIVPVILVMAAYLIHQPTKQPENKKLWSYLLCCLLILTLNFSRIYWLALATGLLVLAPKHRFKRWLTISSLIIVCVPLIFSSLYFFSSRGQSTGLELLGLRLGATTAPTDTSGAIRLAMLPDIFSQIRARPLFGSGLGATVTYNDPNTHELVSRTQFDWGYFELIVELGIGGIIVFLVFLFILLFYLVRLGHTSLVRGLLASGVALGVINITTPALFHGFGILYLVLVLVVIQKNIKDGLAQ